MKLGLGMGFRLGDGREPVEERLKRRKESRRRRGWDP